MRAADLHVMDGLEPPTQERPPAILVEAGSLILLVLGYGLSPTVSGQSNAMSAQTGRWSETRELGPTPPPMMRSPGDAITLSI